MISAIDISISGLVAQRIRLNAISSNLANMSMLTNENGEVAPYQPKFVTFQTDDSLKTQHGAVGVKVGGVHTRDVEPKYKFQLNHPLAIKVGPRAGYVAYPSINMIEEFVNATEATRTYEVNIGVMEVTKDLSQQILQIIA